MPTWNEESMRASGASDGGPGQDLPEGPQDDVQERDPGSGWGGVLPSHPTTVHTSGTPSLQTRHPQGLSRGAAPKGAVQESAQGRLSGRGSIFKPFQFTLCFEKFTNVFSLVGILTKSQVIFWGA